MQKSRAPFTWESRDDRLFHDYNLTHVWNNFKCNLNGFVLSV